MKPNEQAWAVRYRMDMKLVWMLILDSIVVFLIAAALAWYCTDPMYGGYPEDYDDLACVFPCKFTVPTMVITEKVE